MVEFESLDDITLLNRYRDGDPGAFGALYDRYIDKIYRFVYYKTFSKEVAEDLVSDVFHNALSRIHSFDAIRGNFSTWLYGIARNRVIDHYRVKKTTVPIEDVFDLKSEDRTEEVLDAQSTLQKIMDHLKTLSPRQREIIMLRVWEERSYAEIAEIVGGTEASVKMMFSRSIRDIRDQYGNKALLVFFVLAAFGALPFLDHSYYIV